MAPKYKLTYFNVMALGEPIRWLLCYGGIDFENVETTNEEWPKIKLEVPYGKLPILEVEGKTAHQSAAICRYLAKKVGLAGNDDWQNLKIDSTVDCIVDLRTEIYKSVFGTDDAQTEKVKTEILPFTLKRLNSQVKENGGYLVDKKLTWADLFFGAFVDTANAGLKTNILTPYPELQTLATKVWDLPKIKAWREKRPVATV